MPKEIIKNNNHDPSTSSVPSFSLEPEGDLKVAQTETVENKQEADVELVAEQNLSTSPAEKNENPILAETATEKLVENETVKTDKAVVEKAEEKTGETEIKQQEESNGSHRLFPYLIFLLRDSKVFCLREIN